MAGVRRLPDEVLLNVCALLGLPDLRALRLASKLFARPGATAVKTLAAEHCQLPAKAWAIFISAAAVVIQMAYSPTQQEANAEARRLTNLLKTLPPRVQCVSFERAAPRRGQPSSSGRKAARTVLMPTQPAKALAKLDPQLLQLYIQKGVGATPEAAEALFKGLVKVQQLHLTVGAASAAKGAAAPKQVTHKRFPKSLLGCSITSASSIVDAAGLGACKALESLRLCTKKGASVTNVNRLGGCAALQTLHFSASGADAEQLHEQVVTAASQLKRLSCLELPNFELDCISDSWSELLGMAALRKLRLSMLSGMQLTGVAAAGSITHLSCQSICDPCGSGDPPRSGCLAEVLPGLEELRCSSSLADQGCFEVVHMLSGHQRLEVLDLEEVGGDWSELGYYWQGRPFSTMPSLRVVRLLGGVGCSDLHDLLQDLGGCERLEELQLEVDPYAECSGVRREQRATLGLGLRALAEGRCRPSLRSVAVDSCWENQQGHGYMAVSLADAAPLLAGEAGPGRLRQLSADVCLSRRALSEEEVNAARADVNDAVMANDDGDDDDDDGSDGAGPKKPGPVDRAPAALQQVVAQVQEQLEGEGVQGLSGLRAVVEPGDEQDLHVAVVGRVGGCELSLRVWPEVGGG
jgi:hypothetical protein